MMQRGAIVLVDDEKIVLDSLTLQLRSHFGERFLYEAAQDAVEAWEVIDELCCEGPRNIVVVCDCLMPGVRGDRFLVDLRARHPEIPSILLTGHADPEAIQCAVSEARVAAVLHKPWQAVELFALIEKQTVSRPG